MREEKQVVIWWNACFSKFGRFSDHEILVIFLRVEQNAWIQRYPFFNSQNKDFKHLCYTFYFEIE